MGLIGQRIEQISALVNKICSHVANLVGDTAHLFLSLIIG